MEVKAVIFDLDGTLINSIEDIADANNKMLDSYGLPIHNTKEYVKWIGNGAKRLVEFSLPPEERGVNDMDFFNRYMHYYKEHICVKSHVYKGVEKVLDVLTEMNIPIAINTNKPQGLTDLVVQKCLSQWKFESVIGHSNIFPHKPDTKGALHFAKQQNINPKNILFVGDSIVDMQTAKAAGMIPLGVKWGYGKPGSEDENIKIIDSPDEILDFVGIELTI